MALSGPGCGIAEYYNIQYSSPGGGKPWTGWGPIADIDAAMASAASVGPILAGSDRLTTERRRWRPGQRELLS